MKTVNLICVLTIFKNLPARYTFENIDQHANSFFKAHGAFNCIDVHSVENPGMTTASTGRWREGPRRRFRWPKSPDDAVAY